MVLRTASGGAARPASAVLAPFGWVTSSWLAGVAFWLVFGACIDTPVPESPPIVRLVATWDPLACGEPHRVAIDLADDAGDIVSKSAPCALGSLAIDVPHAGEYRGQAYAWELGAPADGSDRTVDLDVEVTAPITRWQLATVP